MFDDTVIKILGNSYLNTPIKSIMSDVQDYTAIINKEDYDYKCTKLVFIDYIEPLISENYYLNINNKIYKIIKVDTCSEHQEVYLYLMNFKDVLVNGIDKKIIIEETTEKITTLDEKIAISDFNINTGDLIEFQSRKWLVTSEIAQDSDSYRSRIRRCRELKYNYQTIYGLIDSQVFDITSTQYFNLVDNEILITVNDKTKVKLNDVIYFKDKAYTVQAVNDTMDNTLVLRCSYSLGDTHKYEIALATNSLDLQATKTYQTTSICKDNQVVVSNPVLEYVVADNTICSIDSTGLITGIKAGSTTITVKYNNAEAILNVNITSVVVTKTYSLTTVQGTFVDYLINNGQVRTYKIIDNLGAEATDHNFVFILEQSELNATITPNTLITKVETISGTSVKLTPINNSSIKGYFYLVATDGDLVVKTLLRVKSIF